MIELTLKEIHLLKFTLNKVLFECLFSDIQNDKVKLDLDQLLIKLQDYEETML